MNLKYSLLFLIMWNANPFSLAARSNRDIFIISNISPHVYIAHPGRTNRINSTSTIIVSAHFLTVIEAQTDEFMARELIREMWKHIKATHKIPDFQSFSSGSYPGSRRFPLGKPGDYLSLPSKRLRNIFCCMEKRSSNPGNNHHAKIHEAKYLPGQQKQKSKKTILTAFPMN